MIGINSRIVNDKLILFSISFGSNKIIYASENIKKAFINLLAYSLNDMDFSKNCSLYLFLNSYAKHLNLKGFNFLDNKLNLSENDLKSNINYIVAIYKEKIKTGNFLVDLLPFLGIKKYIFKMFFLFELLFIRYLLISIDNGKNIKSHLMTDDINKIIIELYLNENENFLLNNLLDILYNADYNIIGVKIEELIMNSSHNYLKESSENLIRNIKIITNYMSLPIINVGIFATMSAGKSTFINALLDKDIIPARNEACTSKIISIRDNDSMNDKIFGYCSLDN